MPESSLGTVQVCLRRGTGLRQGGQCEAFCSDISIRVTAGSWDDYSVLPYAHHSSLWTRPGANWLLNGKECMQTAVKAGPRTEAAAPEWSEEEGCCEVQGLPRDALVVFEARAAGPTPALDAPFAAQPSLACAVAQVYDEDFRVEVTRPPPHPALTPRIHAPATPPSHALPIATLHAPRPPLAASPALGCTDGVVPAQLPAPPALLPVHRGIR